MSRLRPLPKVMLAPNGARKTKADHPALPVTIAETVSAANAAFAEGAQALHAHVRDADQRHSLDAGLYRELIAEMARVVPQMPVQITTEAGGRFDAAAQRALVRTLEPEGASIALREMWPDDGARAEAQPFYAWAAEAGIPVQHILYSTADALRLAALIQSGSLPNQKEQCLFVLGSYGPEGRDGQPTDLAPFLHALAPVKDRLDWAACAFGPNETACLAETARLGGKIRLGFENNTLGPDGHPAAGNATRVRQVLTELGGVPRPR